MWPVAGLGILYFYPIVGSHQEERTLFLKSLRTLVPKTMTPEFFPFIHMYTHRYTHTHTYIHTRGVFSDLQNCFSQRSWTWDSSGEQIKWIVGFGVQGGPPNFPSHWNALWVDGRVYSGVTDCEGSFSDRESWLPCARLLLGSSRTTGEKRI